MTVLNTTKKNLADAIRVVSATTSQSAQDGPAFSGDLSSFYVFRKKDSLVEMFSYFGPLISKFVLDCSSDGDDVCFAVESRRLNKWVSSISDGDVQIELSGTVVKAKSDNGSVSFPSADTTNYPWWDTTLNEAKFLCKIDPDRLDKALDYSRMFVSKDESKRQDLCCCEFVGDGVEDSVLHSTNLKGISMVSISGMEKSRSRVHGRDIPGIRKFLSGCDAEVSVYEHDMCFFIKSNVGSVIGSMKPSVGLPKMGFKDPYGSANIQIKFSRPDWIQVINILSSSTPDDNKKLTVSVGVDNKISLSMPSVAGGDSIIKVSSELIIPDSEKVPFSFKLKYDYFIEIIRKLNDDNVVMKLKAMGGSGYVSFKETDGTDVYTSVLGWDK